MSLNSVNLTTLKRITGLVAIAVVLPQPQYLTKLFISSVSREC